MHKNSNENVRRISILKFWSTKFGFCGLRTLQTDIFYLAKYEKSQLFIIFFKIFLDFWVNIAEISIMNFSCRFLYFAKFHPGTIPEKGQKFHFRKYYHLKSGTTQNTQYFSENWRMQGRLFHSPQSFPNISGLWPILLIRFWRV